MRGHFANLTGVRGRAVGILRLLAISVVALLGLGCDTDDDIVIVDTFVFGSAVLSIETRFESGEPAAGIPLCIEYQNNSYCSGTPGAAPDTTDASGTLVADVTADIQPDTVQTLQVRIWARPDPSVAGRDSITAPVVFRERPPFDTVAVAITLPPSTPAGASSGHDGTE